MTNYKNLEKHSQKRKKQPSLILNKGFPATIPFFHSPFFKRIHYYRAFIVFFYLALFLGFLNLRGFGIQHLVFSSTEKELNTKCVVEMVKNQTILHPATVNLGKGDSRYVLHQTGFFVWPQMLFFSHLNFIKSSSFVNTIFK